MILLLDSSNSATHVEWFRQNVRTITSAVWSKKPWEGWTDIGGGISVPVVVAKPGKDVTIMGIDSLADFLAEINGGLICICRLNEAQLAAIRVRPQDESAVMEAFHNRNNPVMEYLDRWGLGEEPTYAQVMSAYLECDIPCVACVG